MANKAQDISRSVGTNAVNHPGDVAVVQDLLDTIPTSLGGPSTLLKVDGISGPKTQHAIRDFQLRGLGFRWPDGRVDPGGKTIRQLQERAGKNGDTVFRITRCELRDRHEPRTFRTIDTFYRIQGDRSRRRGIYWFATPGARLADPNQAASSLEWRPEEESQRFTSSTPHSIAGFQSRQALHSERSPDNEHAIAAISLVLGDVQVINVRHRWIDPTTTPGMPYTLHGWFSFIKEVF